MEFQEFLNLIRKKKQTIAIVTIIFVLFAVAFTFVQPLRYSAVSKVLVIQGLPEGVDPFQVSKSNEYVASLLTQVISTNSFFKEVVNAGFNIEKTYFPESSDKQVKLWKKTVRASSNSNGIITIKTYHDNRIQVSQISQAINFILKSKHGLYHGFGNLVDIKIIEQPVTSDRPIKPNVFINIFVALAFGILVSLTYIYLFPDNRYNLHLKTQKNDTLASDDIESGQDEFEIDNYETRVENDLSHYDENLDEIEDEKIEIKETNRVDSAEEDPGIYNELRSAMSPPVDLPVVDTVEEVETRIDEDPVIPQPRNIEGQGSMGNVINQPSQRS